MSRIFTLCLALALGTLGLKAQVALGGLFTPLQLNRDTTILYSRDYLVDNPLEEVILPKGLKKVGTSLDTLVLVGNLPQKMASLTFQTAQGSQHLLLIKPSAQALTLSIPRQAIGKGELRVIGSFNNWNRASVPLDYANGKYSRTYYLEPGRYEYKLYRKGEELMDPTNQETVPNGMGAFNNVLEVPSPGEAPGEFKVEALEGGLSVSGLGKPVQFLAFWNNQLLTVPCIKSIPPRCRIALPEAAQEMKRSYLRIYSFHGNQKGRNQLIPLEYGQPVSSSAQLTRTDWHQARLYFLMVDRFKNGDSSNDEPVADTSIQPLSNYLGGDIRGVEQALRNGYFDELGINTLWLSPITQNPTDAWGLWNKGRVHSTFSGYHGYWPVSNVRVDYRFGQAEDVTNLLEEAHKEDYNVLLDYVANHVHINHPVYQNNKDWATNLYLPDGTKNTEKWDEERLTTWFDDHLPTLDLRRYEVVDPMVDSALVWLTDFEFDGFRHDATKHIDELYWRTLTYRIRKNTERPVYQIGETYGSPGLINSYISTGMLDAQFDFNLYDAAVTTFATGSNHQHLLNVLEAGLKTYGYHHLMGNISGNQDRSRFISLASGEVRFDEDQKLAGWDRTIGKPKAVAYKKLALLHAFNNAIPGVPCTYYGDEIGLPGANDPDNRRMMYFENWDADEQNLYQQVQTLNQLRAEHLPLIFGSTQFSLVNEKVLVLRRSYLNEEVVVFLNASGQKQQVTLPFETEAPLHELTKSPARASSDQEAEGYTLPPWSYLILSNQSQP